MHVSVNYLAVLVTAVAIFMLGGLWYSPVMFAKKWVALQGRSMEEMSGGAHPSLYLQVFVCGLLTSVVMALLLSHFPEPTLHIGLMVGSVAWLGFAGATSYGTALFSLKPKALWAIDSGFNLVSFIVAGIILALWR
ncbi:MAG: DUF1761 domain-containing protein [Gemmatimonadaceae bacterium]